jgi:outer membrane receptor protein involved in Fe transport
MSGILRLTAMAIMMTPFVVEAETILDEIVVTAVKTEQTRRAILSRTSVLDRETLTQISHTHINEALHRIPGTWISRGNGQEHLTAIRSPVLTGAGSCGAFLMAQDGISLRAPGFCNVNELFEATTELADRIEVLKGPASSTYGSNALHGMVNVLSPLPEEDLRHLKVEAGPDDYLRTRVSVSNSHLRFDFSGTTDGGYKDESGFDQQKLLLRYQHESATMTYLTTLTYTNLNQETAGFIRGHESYKDSGSRRDNPNPEAYRDARSFRLSSDIRRPLAAGELQFKPYLRSVGMEFIQHFLPGQAVEENGHDSLGLNLLWTDEARSMQLGLEVEYTEGFLEEVQENPTTGSPFLVATIPAGAHYDYEVTAVLAGAFARYEASLGENVRLIAGLRYQFIEYDYDNRMLTGRTREDGTPCGFGGCRFNRPANREDAFRNWSPKLGLIYDIDDNRQLYASLSQGFRAPQATELYRLQAGQDITSIDSVELDALELGLRGGIGTLSWDVSLYTMEKSNFIFRDTSRRTVDNGETTHQGLELALNWSINPMLSAALSFTYAQHRYDNNPALVTSPVRRNDIDTAPRTLGSLVLDWHSSENTSLSLEWTHTGSYYQDPENLNQYEGHDLLHLRSRFQMNTNTQLYLRLMNLTDRDYAERADFAFGTDRYFVGTPRSLYLGIELSL